MRNIEWCVYWCLNWASNLMGGEREPIMLMLSNGVRSRWNRLFRSFRKESVFANYRELNEDHPFHHRWVEFQKWQSWMETASSPCTERGREMFWILISLIFQTVRRNLSTSGNCFSSFPLPSDWSDVWTSQRWARGAWNCRHNYQLLQRSHRSCSDNTACIIPTSRWGLTIFHNILSLLSGKICLLSI